MNRPHLISIGNESHFPVQPECFLISIFHSNRITLRKEPSYNQNTTTVYLHHCVSVKCSSEAFGIVTKYGSSDGAFDPFTDSISETGCLNISGFLNDCHHCGKIVSAYKRRTRAWGLIVSGVYYAPENSPAFKKIDRANQISAPLWINLARRFYRDISDSPSLSISCNFLDISLTAGIPFRRQSTFRQTTSVFS